MRNTELALVMQIIEICEEHKIEYYFLNHQTKNCPFTWGIRDSRESPWYSHFDSSPKLKLEETVRALNGIIELRKLKQSQKLGSKEVKQLSKDEDMI